MLFPPCGDCKGQRVNSQWIQTPVSAGFEQWQSIRISELLECQPFTMSFPEGMKLLWRGALDNGGATKVKRATPLYLSLYFVHTPRSTG